MSIGVAMPSRGLIHSRTMESLQKNMANYDYTVYYSHDKPIPDCFNYTVGKALQDSHKYILILEEDVVMPEWGVIMMVDSLNHGQDIAYYDYPLKDGRNSSAEINGTLYISTGCTMFKREAIKKLLPFTSQYQYHSKTRELLQTLDKDQQQEIYGYHDEHMSLLIKELGLKADCVGLAQHYKLRRLGRDNKNKGYHDIYAC